MPGQVSSQRQAAMASPEDRDRDVPAVLVLSVFRSATDGRTQERKRGLPCQQGRVGAQGDPITGQARERTSRPVVLYFSVNSLMYFLANAEHGAILLLLIP
jgi:hypothetical protein